jgi:sugar phosphate isomerase/epimerase
MKIGMLTDSLADLDLDSVLSTAASLDIQCLEFATGNWSSSPHINLDAMLESAASRREFVSQLVDHGLALSALNCSGNPLHPGAEGKRQHEVTLKTFKLAGMLGIDRVVMMSGLPGGPGDANPNWITTEWPPECRAILQYQWDEKLIPYWRDLVAAAAGSGVTKICLEFHGGQAVYNPYTLRRLREAAGEAIGANYDPSHPIWMGADPLKAIPELKGAIYHVHAKDTRIELRSAAIDGLLETRPAESVAERSWNYVTLGHGHDLEWWRAFCLALQRAGYDDVLSIEHEDASLAPLDGVRQSVRLLKEVVNGSNAPAQDLNRNPRA